VDWSDLIEYVNISVTFAKSKTDFGVLMDRQSQLIQTKLCIPRLRSGVIGRSRLVERAIADPGVVLTLVSAPAGYGKTTLMVELSRSLAQSGTAVAWYALDSSDNDTNLFISYLIEGFGEALQINTALAPVARLLRSSPEFNMEKVIPTIINAVISKDQKCLLVLDDYHFITSPAIHSALTFLLDHLPENVRVIIGSRSDPPLQLARLRAGGKMVEIRAVDLRFTPDEAVQFLNGTMSLSLPSEAIAEIEKSTEGWVTGLQLAALSITGRADSADFASHFGGSNRYLVEYLLQEVVDRQPAEIQRFLLSTSVLERLCGPLCDAVLGGQLGSGAILHQLERANLFIVSLDDESQWYRYHHLFRDFLRTRLKQSQPDREPLLHRAASEWYESQNLLGEAVSQALETRDWDYAANVVEKHGMTIFNRSEISLLHKWCEGFPEETFRTHPLLCILQGWPLGLSYRKENRRRVEERLSQAEQAANKLEDKRQGRWLIGQAALVRLSLCLTPDPATDPEQIIAFAQRTLDLLSADDPRRSLPYSAIGYAYMSLQNVPMAQKGMEEYRSLSLAGGFYYGAVAPTFYLANLAYYQGRLKHAEEICLQFKAGMAAVIANPEQELPALGSLDIIQGCILLEENQLDEAERALVHGLELIGGTNNPFYRMMACISLFRLREIQGRETEAFQFLDDIEGAWPDIAFYTQGLRLMHLIRTTPGAPQTRAQAENWAQAFSPYIGEHMRLPGIGPFGGTEAYYRASLIWVQAQVILGKPEETLSYLERQQSVAEAQDLRYRLIELSVAESQARKSMGADQLCFQALERALKLAQSTGCLRVFDQGPALNHLLKEASHRGICRDYIERIMKTIGSSLNSGAERQEILSERELEILRLMVSGASNQEMADQLFVTIGTIKSHINHILGKLDARNRLEAVARARELGLLSKI
jgi:LuxR family transcriptional regulator, maltose regulon positive regulatory protein